PYGAPRVRGRRLRPARLHRLRLPRGQQRQDQDQSVRRRQANSAQADDGRTDVMAREMKLTLRALSVLLSYPSEELVDHAGEVRTALRDEAALPRGALTR